MWSSIFVNIIISIIIIFIAHSIWNYIKNNYSTKKTKDLIGCQIQKYKNMMEELQNQKEQMQINNRQSNITFEISMEDDLAKWMEESIQEDSIQADRIQEESLQTEYSSLQTEYSINK